MNTLFRPSEPFASGLALNKAIERVRNKSGRLPSTSSHPSSCDPPPLAGNADGPAKARPDQRERHSQLTWPPWTIACKIDCQTYCVRPAALNAESAGARISRQFAATFVVSWLSPRCVVVVAGRQAAPISPINRTKFGPLPPAEEDVDLASPPLLLLLLPGGGGGGGDEHNRAIKSQSVGRSPRRRRRSEHYVLHVVYTTKQERWRLEREGSCMRPWCCFLYLRLGSAGWLAGWRLSATAQTIITRV